MRDPIRRVKRKQRCLSFPQEERQEKVGEGDLCDPNIYDPFQGQRLKSGRNLRRLNGAWKTLFFLLRYREYGFNLQEDDDTSFSGFYRKLH